MSSLELDSLHDAEAIYERGRRSRFGIGKVPDDTTAWSLYIQAAQLGHPVALALCFDFGRGTTKNLQRAVQLYRESAARGHPAGSFDLALSISLILKVSTIWPHATSTATGLS